MLLAMKLHLLALAAGLSAGLGLSGPALAQTPRITDVLDGTIRPGWRTDAGSRMVALHLRLAPGWKTYWRAPGEAGIPPVFDWTGSDNVRAVQFHWPQPTVFQLNGLSTIGYHGELVLPIEITPRDADAPIRLRATVDLGVCRDICIPAALTLSADLDLLGAPDATIRAALADRPATASEAGLRAIRCTVDPLADGLRLTAELVLPALGGDETTVFETPDPSVWVSGARTERQGDRLVAVADMVGPTAAPFALNRSAVRITVLGDRGAVELVGCPGG